VLSTCFELQPEFVESDFLPNLLGVDKLDARDELARRLARMKVATFLVDGRRYAGRPRLLDLEIVPVALSGGSLRAPMVLIVHERAVRLLIGSADLTEPGYRRNREVMAVLTATEEDPGHGSLISTALSQVPPALDPWWTPRAKRLMALARERLVAREVFGRNAEEWLVWSGDQVPLWRRFSSLWPDGEPVRRITIVSPSWSEEQGEGPLAQLLSHLRQRRGLAVRGDVRLLSEATPDSQAGFRPLFPATFAAVDLSRYDLLGIGQAVDPRLRQDVAAAPGVQPARVLHMKLALFEGPKTSLMYMGSAEFTGEGWGFGETRDIGMGSFCAGPGGGGTSSRRWCHRWPESRCRSPARPPPAS